MNSVSLKFRQILGDKTIVVNFYTAQTIRSTDLEKHKMQYLRQLYLCSIGDSPLISPLVDFPNGQI